MIYEEGKISFKEGCIDYFKGLFNIFGRTTRKGLLCGLLMEFTVISFVITVISLIYSPAEKVLVPFAVILLFILFLRRVQDVGFTLFGFLSFLFLLSILNLGKYGELLQIIILVLPSDFLEIRNPKYVKFLGTFFRKNAIVRGRLGIWQKNYYQ